MSCNWVHPRAKDRLPIDSTGVVTLDLTGTSEWDRVFGSRRYFGADVRVTSSSRLPGKAIVGIVDHSGGSKLTRCPKCSGLRHDLGGPHAPQAHSDGTVTDCVGDVVVQARAVAA